jgi:DNA sulfur modification protein DndC
MSTNSAFKEMGLKKTVELIHEEIRELYAMDDVPWIIGYSGGKDSTACVQLVWNALESLPRKSRTKPVHVISTDTMVENPVVAAWVSRSLDKMRKLAVQTGVPIDPTPLKPEVADTFWVNLLGKGYPAPRHLFRWCTERLKIRPSNAFISNIVRKHGEAILVLGTRKQESITRARTMAKHSRNQLRERLTPNASLMGSLIYTPIEDWSNDDVWTYLTQVRNPWDFPNEDLLGMYAGATEGGECPLVVDSNTPSCGDSRFGCWVCTLVDKDKSMSAMIQNDQEKEWMLPLLDLRNELDMRDQPGDGQGEGLKRDRERRDFRRINGRLHLYAKDEKSGESTRDSRRRTKLREIPEQALVHGPYFQGWRESFLKKVLEAQVLVRQHGGAATRQYELLTIPELEEIRRIWVVEKHEIEDSLPRIYQEATGEPYPGIPLDDQCPLDHQTLKLLDEVCSELGREGEDVWLRYAMVREMLSVESRFRSQGRRAGLFQDLEEALERHFYWNEADAAGWAMIKLQADRAPQEAVEAIQVLAPVLTVVPDDDPLAEPGLPEVFT